VREEDKERREGVEREGDDYNDYKQSHRNKPKIAFV
jgi:hypothetical protein